VATNDERSDDATWFARQLGDGWVSAGDGVFYPPTTQRASAEPALETRADPRETDAFDLAQQSRRRQELIRMRERLTERVASFPNSAAERQLRDVERELRRIVRRFSDLAVRADRPRPRTL
jgi:hypothetical protein